MWFPDSSVESAESFTLPSYTVTLYEARPLEDQDSIRLNTLLNFWINRWGKSHVFRQSGKRKKYQCTTMQLPGICRHRQKKKCLVRPFSCSHTEIHSLLHLCSTHTSPPNHHMYCRHSIQSQLMLWLGTGWQPRLSLGRNAYTNSGRRIIRCPELEGAYKDHQVQLGMFMIHILWYAQADGILNLPRLLSSIGIRWRY